MQLAVLCTSSKRRDKSLCSSREFPFIHKHRCPHDYQLKHLFHMIAMKENWEYPW